MEIKEAIGKAKSEAKKRKFTQSVDLFINFKSIDMAKQDNKLNIELVLPKGRGKKKKVCVIAEAELASNAKGVADKILMAAELEKMGGDKKAIKALAESYDFFIAQASLMPVVGKYLGQVLGPRGKMPKPVPPNANLEPLVAKLSNTIIIKTKGKNLPVAHVPIGTEAMSDDDLTENAQTVINAVKAKLPLHEQNIKDIYVKTTMGPVVTVDIGGEQK